MNNNIFKRKFKRRDFFKMTAAGICGIGFASLLGRAQASETLNKELISGAQKGLIKKVRSKWFIDIKGNKIKCKLCPKECKLNPGQRGLCRVRKNINGKGYSLVYGNLALIQEDPIERKPFFHVLPGSRALSVSTAGCNLECKFCEVWDMALANPEELFSYDMSPDVLIKHAQASGVRSISYAFGEPVVFYEYMKDTAKEAKTKGFLNLMHTAGYINQKPLREISKILDAVNVDLKSFNSKFYSDIVGGKIETVLETLKILKAEKVHIEITNILIPTLNDDMKTVQKMCKWISKELGSDVPLHFVRFYPLYKLSSLPRTPVSTLDKARNIALDSGLNYVYVSRVTGHKGENTFCCGCGEKIISRLGFVVDNIEIKNGRCNFCNTLIPGKWN